MASSQTLDPFQIRGRPLTVALVVRAEYGRHPRGTRPVRGSTSETISVRDAAPALPRDGSGAR